MYDSHIESADLLVVGGGIAGLTAAALAAQQGHQVVLVEQARAFGGRAATNVRQQTYLNLGAHALGYNGHAFRVLTELGVAFRGNFPITGDAVLVDGGTMHALPQTLRSILGSQWLTLRDKWRIARLLASLDRIDTRALDQVPVDSWLAGTLGTGHAAQLIAALFRVTTYGNEFGKLSAGAAIDQLRRALKNNVWYLDHGWQTLVDGLRQIAEQQGARIYSRVRATAVQTGNDIVAVELNNGQTVSAAAVIIAAAPRDVLDIAGHVSQPHWRQQIRSLLPVRVACLDLALRRLPISARRFALGIDEPFYFSVHSGAAQLAPDALAVVHVMKYLGAEIPSGEVEGEMEQFLDQVQPGWRDEVVTRRTLPNMTVTHALPSATTGGLAGRPTVCVPGEPRLFVAGDWVGPVGMLADAAVASAEAAVAAAGQLLRTSRDTVRRRQYA